VDLAPSSSAGLVAYATALDRVGRKEEAAAIRNRLRQSAVPSAEVRSRVGLIEYLNLPPAEQRARYMANLRKASDTSGDVQWRIRLGRELFAERKTAEALEVFQALKASVSDPRIAAQCGSALLEFEQYAPAAGFLESAVNAAPTQGTARLDLATALFHL